MAAGDTMSFSHYTWRSPQEEQTVSSITKYSPAALENIILLLLAEIDLEDI